MVKFLCAGMGCTEIGLCEREREKERESVWCVCPIVDGVSRLLLLLLGTTKRADDPFCRVTSHRCNFLSSGGKLKPTQQTRAHTSTNCAEEQTDRHKGEGHLHDDVFKLYPPPPPPPPPPRHLTPNLLFYIILRDASSFYLMAAKKSWRVELVTKSYFGIFKRRPSV